MITYSEIVNTRLKDKLTDLGLIEVPSPQQEMVFQENEINDKLLSTILELEITGRTYQKMQMDKEAERSQEAIAKHRQEIIDIKLQQMIDKSFPKERMQEPFKHFHDAFLRIVTNNLKDKVNLDEQGNVVLSKNKTDEDSKKMGMLDKLLQNTRVKRFSAGETLEDALYKAVENEGQHQFFKI